ncbi:hypothetical protein EBH_0085800 [Eimeria brunetti]|uniref:Uncharacterized protein n=1 Tax=Eimeria brunetti TaxID=51314 RepID=U6LPP2_9EIME|nr:hypothetical protein EBH_0085800 [Eimeria brunetti]
MKRKGTRTGNDEPVLPFISVGVGAPSQAGGSRKREEEPEFLKEKPIGAYGASQSQEIAKTRIELVQRGQQRQVESGQEDGVTQKGPLQQKTEAQKHHAKPAKEAKTQGSPITKRLADESPGAEGGTALEASDKLALGPVLA